jgi:hypothetical protein
MFKTITKYFGFLKQVPLLPHLYDGCLRLCTFIRNKKLVGMMDQIENEVSAWKGVSVGIHKYGGIQFDVDGREIGHIHGNGLVDILYNRKLKAELIAAKRTEEHHAFLASGWTSFYIKSENDCREALALLELSYKMKTRE